MEFYWTLKYGDYKDLKTIMIPPASVENVKRRWNEGQPIHTTNGSIPANQIREFEISDRPFNPQPLLEEVAQAFREPMDNGISVEARWVKKYVTQSKWDKFYSASPGYKHLGDYNGMVEVAFRIPTHLIDQNVTPYCSTEEINRLDSIV